MLPSWIAESAAPRPAPVRRRVPFLERTLRHSAEVVQHVVFAERAARRPGFLQSLDARVKLLSILALLVAATFLHHLPSLWLLGAFAVSAIALSRIELGLLFNRVWWMLPAVFVIVALPAALNFVTPGETIVTLFRTEEGIRVGPVALPREVTITRQGTAAAALVITRVWVGVLLTVALTLTTRWQALVKACHTSMTAPFVLILSMTYRYIFLLLRVVDDMHLAKRARTISPGSLAAEHRWIGGRVAYLFSRSRQLTDRVYAAMLARGYRGEARTLVESRFGAREALWTVACGAAIVGVLAVDRVLLGDLLW